MLLKMVFLLHLDMSKLLLGAPVIVFGETVLQQLAEITCM